MVIQEHIYPGSKVICYLDAEFAYLKELAGKQEVVILTDENIFAFHAPKFSGYRVIQIAPGEKFKSQSTVDAIITKLVEFETDRNTLLVGVGGGVVTDLTGYVAAIYMRGIPFALVPTSLLAMVDASIGGKNGIDVGLYKNLVGTFRQPGFILYDHSFLQSLPLDEWVNGFAEVIKHACIKDTILFSMLERYTLHDFRSDATLVAELVERNVQIKSAVVTADPFEKGERKILNFGHTIGHALENLYELPHGHAISIGMVAACNLSEKKCGLHFSEANKIVKLLSRYQLPVDMEADYENVFGLLKMDKKRVNHDIQFILLPRIGQALVQPISLEELQQHLKEIL